MNKSDSDNFRALCEAAGLAVTHQRQVTYQVLQSMPGHPSPEEVYEQVRLELPSIALATVYKHINVFIASGMFHDVSLHHGSRRVEINSHPHHHLVCTVCRSITDVDEEELGLVRREEKLPHGFLAERYSVDLLGKCADCQRKA
ncbi:MAG TPA: transcriptional repressor [Acidisarcina sp.]